MGTQPIIVVVLTIVPLHYYDLFFMFFVLISPMYTLKKHKAKKQNINFNATPRLHGMAEVMTDRL